ncbi:DUF3500 domain-containing protein [Micromonospora sp. CA-244673]|uniref:DUF3500 domain-containing protein n=1 Tax=Micromonospora sp. CA-244673 TaxID=3239958 RepID=UPI003D8E4770
MRGAGGKWLDGLDQAQRAHALRRIDDPALRQITYLPRPRPGLCIADMTRTQRKAAHRLLATGLSRPAYGQATAIMALEEVLDRQEGWRRGRHSNDFWVVLFGDPAEERWAWRWEGHHLSLTITIDGEQVYPTPLFLGANPATLRIAGRPILRPLALEEDLARTLLDTMGPVRRNEAILGDVAPSDIRSSTLPEIKERIEPLGVASSRLDATSRSLLHQLLSLYLARLPAPLSGEEAHRVLAGDELYFAWEGSTRPGDGHYYRLQGPDLLIEYDNTSDAANHAHTVLRRLSRDFGGDLLREHLTAGHHADGEPG